MNSTNVPAGAQARACPPASHESLVALLELLPDQHRPGIRAMLSGPQPDRPHWGQIHLSDEWLASVLGLLGLGSSWTRPGEPTSIRIDVEYDDRDGPRVVISACDRPTSAQASADAELRRNLEVQGRLPPARAPDKLRQLFALVPMDGGGPRWQALAPGLMRLHESQIVTLVQREVDFADPTEVANALRDAADYTHWAGADAILIVTGDRAYGSRVFSDAHVVEAACDVGVPVLTLAGPVPTLVDALAWRSSPIPGALQGTIEEILRGELERADRSRLDRIAGVLSRPRTASRDDTWPTEAPF